MPQSISAQRQGFHFLHVVYQAAHREEAGTITDYFSEGKLKFRPTKPCEGWQTAAAQVLVSGVLSFVIKVMQLTFSCANL